MSSSTRWSTSRGGDEPRGGQDHTHCGVEFPEAGKKCVTCGSKWVAFGRYVKDPECPFCGAFTARVIREASCHVTPVRSYVQRDGGGLTILAAGRKRRTA